MTPPGTCDSWTSIRPPPIPKDYAKKYILQKMPEVGVMDSKSIMHNLLIGLKAER